MNSEQDRTSVFSSPCLKMFQSLDTNFYCLIAFALFKLNLNITLCLKPLNICFTSNANLSSEHSNLRSVLLR